MTACVRNKPLIFLLLCLVNNVSTIYSVGTRVNDPRIPASPWSAKFPLKLSGFIKLDGFFDSRQVIADEDGNSVIFPAPKRIDPVGKDINHQGQFHMIGLETRLRIDVTGPDIGCAQSQAAIECDFVGVVQAVNAYRLRHAYAAVGIPQFLFLSGLYWHPMMDVACAPDQLSVDAGIPMAIECRAPQMRATVRLNDYVNLSIMAGSQFIFVNNGPNGFSSEYVRNSMTPNANIRLDAKWNDTNIIGGSVDFKRLRPRLESNTGYKVNEIFNSVAGAFFVAYNWTEEFHTKFALSAGQNMTNFRIMSGYAVHSIAPITDERTYANLSSVAVWSELVYDAEWYEPALFIGWVKNLGASTTIIPSTTRPDGSTERLIYGLTDQDIDTTFRAAPRLRLFFDPLTVGFEGEYTHSGYGIIQPKGTVIPTNPVWDFRVTMSFYYYF